jgi:hypothetical protein
VAIRENVFAALGVRIEWVDFPGGTGAIMQALADGEIDMATPLTEGAITAIANGNPSQLVSVWVDSPLLWGVHVAGNSPAQEIADVEGQRFAISRFGSGSELMSLVMAEDLGWQLNDSSWVPVGNLEGALAALPAGEAEVFLWNKSMTQPHVSVGTFKRVGVVPTPWPSFAVAAAAGFLERAPGLAHAISEVARSRAAALELDESLAQLVVDQYGLELDNALDWVAQVDWTAPGAEIDTDMVDAVTERMRSIGRIR